MRVIQVSDTHISVEHDHFQRNTDLVLQHLKGLQADLFVHTGDLSMDGAGQPRDLEMSRQWNEQLPGEVMALPGNHDVGDLASIRPDQPINDARLSAWRGTIGPDHWKLVKGGWCFIGLNAMLLGSGHPDEEAQFDWLASALEDDKPIAVFTHKPLCISRLDEGAGGYWTVAPQPRERIVSMLTGKLVKLIASGHLHIQRHKTIEGIDHVWGPASSFVVGASQEDLGGERQIGYVEHLFEEDTVTSRFIRPIGVDELLFDPVRDEIYPS